VLFVLIAVSAKALMSFELAEILGVLSPLAMMAKNKNDPKYKQRAP
jgi:hypothetical protein